MEEILIAAVVLNLLSNKVQLDTLPEKARHFQSLTGLRTHPLKPVLGKNIFKYESGIHADGIDKNPMTYEPYNPEIVGRQRTLIVGKHSGKQSIINKLKDMGLECDKPTAETILQLVREASVRFGRNLSEQEIVELYIRCTQQGLEEIAR